METVIVVEVTGAREVLEPEVLPPDSFFQVLKAVRAADRQRKPVMIVVDSYDAVIEAEWRDIPWEEDRAYVVGGADAGDDRVLGLVVPAAAGAPAQGPERQAYGKGFGDGVRACLRLVRRLLG